MAKSFDVAVIGAGPGGYTAAIRAAQLGLNTVCIDDWKNAKGKPSLGGTCLNVGCIPSKALLESSENYERALHKFGEHGITVKDVAVDIATMLARKDKIVDTFTGGIGLLFRKNKVTSMHGRGRFVAGGTAYQIEVRDGDAAEMIEAKHVIIATGSIPRQLPFAPVDNERIVDNTGALALPQVPKRLGVIGAGVIGLEMGSVWKRLGSQVTMLEALPNFLQAADEQVAKEALRVFTKVVGLDIRLGVKIGAVKISKKGVTVEYRRPGRRAEGGIRRARSWPSGARRNRQTWARKPSASSSTAADSSKSTIIAAPAWRMSTRSATWCAARCSRTSPRKRAWRSPK